MTVIVSEETGKISLAFEGQLITDLDQEKLKSLIHQIVMKEPDDKVGEGQKGRFLWMGRSKTKE